MYRLYQVLSVVLPLIEVINGASFSSTKTIKKIVDEGKNTGETINKIKALIDAPPNIKTPEYLGKWAKESAKNTDYKCTVLKEKQYKKRIFVVRFFFAYRNFKKKEIPITILSDREGGAGFSILEFK
mgnify:CR=1 FL=1